MALQINGVSNICDIDGYGKRMQGWSMVIADVPCLFFLFYFHNVKRGHAGLYRLSRLNSLSHSQIVNPCFQATGLIDCSDY